ncbi:MAG: site-specific DNA-methyltransferase [Bacteroidaceae bacterium]|nr:site-specific DNA-methyltransferase [Bacteroidaceae bacterium]
MLQKNDGKIFENNNLLIGDWMPLLYRVLKENTHAYVMTNFLNLEEMMMEAKKAGFLIHNLLIWEKNNVTPSRWYMKNAEYTLFIRKGKSKPINNLGSKTVHQFDNIIGSKTHPTEKPVDLMKLYVGNSSELGQVVLDPFMGTGSTGIACKELGRRFIGIEKDKSYFDVARMRLQE